MLVARDAQLTLGYVDLWRARGGAPLHVRKLRAVRLDAQLIRLADGRTSWQFGKKTETPDAVASRSSLPVFGRQEVDSGSTVYRDALLAVDLDARVSLIDDS